MAEPRYLTRQREFLRSHLSKAIPAAERERHAAFVLGQRHGGGFAGREGDADVYYTAFGLLDLLLLDNLSPSIAAETQSYLSAQLSEMKNLTDLFSLVHAAKLVEQVNTTSETIENLAALSELLETFRSLDGGYARVPNAKFGSTYATFLTLLAYDELGAVAPEPARVYDFVLSRQRDDGGFVEISAMKRSGANPTCAAIGSLLLLGKQMSAETTTPWRDKAVTFLLGLQADEGGFLANSRIPLADLLSTFTTLWTLHDLHELKQLDSAAIRQFVQGLAVPTGGFRAGVWDERADVEYTFYGLGCSALLASLGA